MDFDSNNKTLQPIYDKLDSLINKRYGLSNVFKDIIFRDCDQFDRDYRLSLIHISEPTRLILLSRMPSSA